MNDTVNRNWSGETIVSFDGVEDAGQAGRRRAERERQQLGRDGVDAVRGGRQLVLADRLPGTPDPESCNRYMKIIAIVTITTIMMQVVARSR